MCKPEPVKFHLCLTVCVCALNEATFYISKKIKVIFSPSHIVDAFAQTSNHKAHTVKTPNWKNWHGSRSTAVLQTHYIVMKTDLLILRHLAGKLNVYAA